MKDRRGRVTVTGSGAATAPGGYANSGIHLGDVNLFTGIPVRTRYRQQVQRIAPSNLLDRATELADLAEFCSSPATAGMYVWWRAKAWSGKSALMSWFVLHPPMGVRIVSFFITARLASQNDRGAFIDNVMEQLLAMLGETLPPLLTESTREAHLLGLIAEAAEACRSRGEQFVLLVDGLDEDAGVHDRPDSHSIAALLPAEPPRGMRIIVASRPNPPIAADVPAHHSLRNNAIIRPLEPSPKAQAIQEEMERELKRLLRGTAAEQDLLGLVAAAGGGLSAADLAQLTGWLRWEIADQLRTVTGRSFAVRNSHFQPGGPDVFLLGHEELQATALEMIGPTRVAGYRDRVHTWAAQYKERRWPHDTPEYLLRGYFRLLQANGDVQRMVACATDPARQDRALDFTGGDAAALYEVTTTQRIIVAQDDPDLIAMIRLAIHRDYLRARNDRIPARLPAVWATLGQPNRAESIADSIPNLASRTEALVAVADAVTEAGHLNRAASILDRAEQIARSITESDEKLHALYEVAGATLRAGDLDRTAELVDSICAALSIGEIESKALAEIVGIAAKAGQLAYAVELANSIADPHEQASALASIIEALGRARQFDRATNVLDSAERIAKSSTIRYLQAYALRELAVAAARAGLLDRAEELADDVMEVSQRGYALVAIGDAAAAANQFDRAVGILDRAQELFSNSITDPLDQAHALVRLAETAATAGQPVRATELLDRAEELTTSIADPGHRIGVRQDVAAAAARCGFFGRAEEAARSITPDYQQAKALVALVKAVARDGLLDRAEEIADAIARYGEYACALVAIAEAAIRADEPGRAADILDRAQRVAHSSPSLYRQARAFVAVAEAVGRTNQLDRAADILDRAEEVAKLTTDPSMRASALAAIAQTAAKIDQLDRAAVILAQAENLADSISEPDERERVRAEIAMVAAKAGLLDRAEELAKSLSNTYRQAEVLIALGAAAARANQLDRAASVLELAERRIYTIANPPEQACVLVKVVEPTAKAGLLDRAGGILDSVEELANSIIDYYHRTSVLMEVAKAAARAGYLDRAEKLACSSRNPYQARALVSVVEAVAHAGHLDHAEEIATSISGDYEQAHALLAITEAAVNAGQFDRAVNLLDRAEKTAHAVTGPHGQAYTLVAVVDVIATVAGDRCERISHSGAAQADHADAPTRHSLRRRRARAVAKALELSDWDVPLRQLVDLVPNAAIEIVAELVTVGAVKRST